MIELVSILLISIPILLTLFDAAIILIAVATNDAACRDAARAAASGPPGMMVECVNRLVGASDAPSKRATMILKKVYAPGGCLKISDEIQVHETVKSPVPSAGTGGGAVMGEVTVAINADVYPPFIVGHLVGEMPIKLQKEETYAYTYVLPPSP